MITDGNVRYRHTVNKVRVIGVYVVNKSICGAGYSRGLSDYCDRPPRNESLVTKL